MCLLKVCVICLNFHKGNLHQQPRRYIYEIAKRLTRDEPNTVLLTDAFPRRPREQRIEELHIRRVSQIHALFGKKRKEFLKEVEILSPSVILWTIGITSFLRPAIFKQIGKPIIGIYTSPHYGLFDLIRLGIKDFLRNLPLLAVHIAGLAVPRIIVRRTLNSQIFYRVITESRAAKEGLTRMGVRADKIEVVLPGVDHQSLAAADNNSEPSNCFTAAYFGPPLTLRGADTVIEAFARFKQEVSNSKLVMLYRLDLSVQKIQKSHQNTLARTTKKMGLVDNMEICVDRMSKEDMFARLKNTNIIVLPFKMVSSDMPLTVLEALSLGVPVITTRVDGLPELVNGRRGILVHPNRPEEVFEQMLLLYRNPNLAREIGLRAREYILQQPSWDQMYEKIKRISVEAVQLNPSHRQTN